MRLIQPAAEADAETIASAIAALREARRLLRDAKARMAAKAVARALKSAEGAARHVRHRIARSKP